MTARFQKALTSSSHAWFCSKCHRSTVTVKTWKATYLLVSFNFNLYLWNPQKSLSSLTNFHHSKPDKLKCFKIDQESWFYTIQLFVGALWCSGSCSRLVISGSWVRIPLGAYALRQGILSTIVSLDPGVVNGYPAGIYSLKCLWAPI